MIGRTFLHIFMSPCFGVIWPYFVAALAWLAMSVAVLRLLVAAAMD
jgi:hypothetical protein